MDVFDLFAKISLDTSEYEQGLSEASSKGSNFADTLKNGLANAAKIGAAALGTATAGVVALTKNAIENYAEYEQLIGGVETLFKNSADVVSGYAANAYKTAGLSANDYMETVTSFSASLLQSLGGDTEAAAAAADKAITDMADNANKMGTAMESIQNAYQGFAKQNYTMLDNLKLGYGGTKEEMQRLIDKANALREAQGLNADLTIESYADVVDAIHTVQTEMGITGATAIEAGETISGSLSAAKSAWQNLVTGIADENQNFDVLVNNFVDSVATVGDNLLPRIEVAIGGVGKLIDGIAPQITTALPGVIDSLLPPLLNGAASLVSSVAAALPSMAGTITQQLPAIVTQIADIVPQVATEMMSLTPMLADAGIAIVLALADGAVTALPELIPAAVQMIDQLAMTITDPATLTSLLTAAISIITVLAEGILEAIPQLIDTGVQIVTNLVTFISEPGNLEMLISTAVLLISTISGGLVEAIPQLFGAATQLIVGLVGYFLDADNVVRLIDMALELVGAIAKGLIEASAELLMSADELIRDVIDRFLETDWSELGRNILDGVLSGLKEKVATVKNWFSNFWSGLVGDAETALDSHSPSRVFAQLGKNMIDGLIVGWQGNYSSISDAISTGLDFSESEIQTPEGTDAQSSIIDTILGMTESEMTEEVKNKAQKIIQELAGGVKNNIKMLKKTAEELVDEFGSVFDNAGWSEIGDSIIKGISDGINAGWSWLEKSVIELAQGLLEKAKETLGISPETGSMLEFDGSAMGADAGNQSSGSVGGSQVGEGTMVAASAAQDIVELLAKALIDMATLQDELGTGLKPDPSFETAAIEMIKALTNFLLHDEEEKNVAAIIQAAIDIIEELGAQLEKDDHLNPLEDAAQTMITVIKQPLMDESWEDIGQRICDGIAAGLQAGWPWLEALVAELARRLYAAACAALGINSPSKLFMRIGDGMAEGLGLGWEKAFSGVKRSVVSDLDFGTATLDVGATGRRAAYGYSLVQNIYAKAQTPAELLEESHAQAQKELFLGV